MRYLIRTKENRISGPFTKDVILARMQKGELREMDEVCPADGYWIYLHERDESMKMLGVALARSDDFHEEATETDTETVTVTQPLAAPFVPSAASAGARVAAPAAAEPSAVPAAPKATDPREPNRPELIRMIKFVLWVLAFVMGLIAFRIYQVAHPI
jgi:hypothetical protein